MHILLSAGRKQNSSERQEAPNARKTSRRMSTVRKISAFLVPFETGDETLEDGKYLETMGEGELFRFAAVARYPRVDYGFDR